MAHITPFDQPNDWRTEAVKRFSKNLRRKAPGLANELTNPEKNRRRWIWSPQGLLRESHEINADGPILKRHMDIFSAKLGMALFYEHIGYAPPLDGLIFTTWFLNAGLAQQSAEAILSIMPMLGELRQGTKAVTEQFAYRFNTDERTIVAALSGFHSSLHILTVTTSDFATYQSLASYPHMVVTSVQEFSSQL
ncbi:UNVERIFIED_ORG: hypothetical protein ABIC34_003874 [Sphingomonas sp. 1057]